jgi:DNA-binding PadR family transcriptional regulator
MKSEVLKELRKALVIHFLDSIVLIYFKNQSRLSGYDILALLQTRFGFVVSSGTIYSLLYSIERKGLVKGELTNGKRVYSLTEEGRDFIEDIVNSKEEIVELVRSFFESQ